MPAILEPETVIAPTKRKFSGKVLDRLKHYGGAEGPPKPTLGSMMSQLEGRPAPMPSIMPQSPQDLSVGQGFEKLGLERRAAAGAGEVGQILSNAEDTGEILLSDKVPKMPLKPGNVIAASPGGATSEPLPQDRPAAKSGPTPQQARIQAEMDSAAERITGRESAALKNQRALTAMRASQSLNAPAAAEDLLSSIGQNTAPAESAAGNSSRIRDKLAGVARSNPVTRAAEGVGGILEKIPGVARTGRILGRLAGSPAARITGKWLYPAIEAYGAFGDINRGRMEDTEEIDEDTGEQVVDPNTGRTQQVSKGIFEPTIEEMQYAAKGGNSLLGAPLFEKREASVPFTEDEEGVTKKLPWAGGIIPEVASEVAQAGAFGPIAATALMGRKVIKAVGAGGKAWAEASKAKEYKKASEKKYGTVEKATETRHKMKAEQETKAAADSRQRHLEGLAEKYGVDLMGGE